MAEKANKSILMIVFVKRRNVLNSNRHSLVAIVIWSRVMFYMSKIMELSIIMELRPRITKHSFILNDQVVEIINWNANSITTTIQFHNQILGIVKFILPELQYFQKILWVFHQLLDTECFEHLPLSFWQLNFACSRNVKLVGGNG